MTAANFAPSVALIKGYEGGFVNSPKDPGGATNFGITEAALSAHRGRPCTVADVHGLTWAEAVDVYHSTYWPAVKGDVLPPGVDLIIFDAGVNCGRGRAVTFLQSGLGMNTIDGVLGSQTLAVLAATKDRVGLIARIRTTRATYYHSLQGYRTFGDGWINRLNSVAHASTSWATKAA